MFSYLVTGLLIGLATAKIPSDIEFCGRRNPNLGTCIKDVAEKLLPGLGQGIPEWGVPKGDPLHVKQIDVANEDRFKAKLNDVKVYGLSKLEIVSAIADLDAGTISADVTMPSIKVEGEYDGTTKFLVTLAGKGPITVISDKITAKLNLGLEYVERKGVKYAYVNSATLKIDATDFKAHYQSYDNPGGTLDEAINSALNGDRRSLLDSMIPTLEPNIAKEIINIANGIAKHFTFDELFPDRA